MSEVTEEIFGLFLLLQIIENDSIKLDVLKLNHEWPNLHNETEWVDYKVRMPEIMKHQNELAILKKNNPNISSVTSDMLSVYIPLI